MLPTAGVYSLVKLKIAAPSVETLEKKQLAKSRLFKLPNIQFSKIRTGPRTNTAWLPLGASCGVIFQRTPATSRKTQLKFLHPANSAGFRMIPPSGMAPAICLRWAAVLILRRMQDESQALIFGLFSMSYKIVIVYQIYGEQ